MKRKITCAVLICMIFSAVFAVESEKVFGLYKVVLHEKTGTFSLFITDAESGKFIPVLSTIDNASGTQLYLKAADSVYVLNPRAGVTVTQLFTETGFKCDYIVKNKALIVLEMKFSSSVPGIPADIAAVNVIIQNTSQAASSLALKTVFDTTLGEKAVRHFSTASKISVNEEIVLQGMAGDRYLRSSDGTNSFQFLLHGADIVTPETVTVANRDLLLTSIWIPLSKPGRGFNSLFSFNNSAVSLHWPPVKLAPAAKSSIRFYFSAASGETQPADINAHFFTGKLPPPPVQEPSPAEEAKPAVSSAAPQIIPVPEQKEPAVSASAAPVPVPSAAVSPAPAEVPAAEPQKEEPKASVSAAAQEPAPADLDETPQEVEIPESAVPVQAVPEKQVLTKEQMDPEYVSNLLARIRKLEGETDSLNKEEIIRLNQELDAILEQVRQE